MVVRCETFTLDALVPAQAGIETALDGGEQFPTYARSNGVAGVTPARTGCEEIVASKPGGEAWAICKADWLRRSLMHSL